MSYKSYYSPWGSTKTPLQVSVEGFVYINVPSINSTISYIYGHGYKVGQVGGFVKIPQGYINLYQITVIPYTLIVCGLYFRYPVVACSISSSCETLPEPCSN